MAQPQKKPPRSPVKPPKLPAYNLAHVQALKQKILGEPTRPHWFTRLEGEGFKDFLDHLAAVLPADCDRLAILDSCRALLDREITPEVMDGFAWRIAGNVRRLKRGLPVLPWSTQAAVEWMPVQFEGAELGLNKFDMAGCWYRLQVQAGSCCPMWISKFWSRPQVGYLARLMGFNQGVRKASRIPFGHSYQLVGMRAYILVEPALSLNGTPGFRQLEVPSTMMKHNIELMQGRLKKPCEPMKFMWPCHTCIVGYDKCRYGVHERTYILKVCEECHQERPHDPERPFRCVQCQTRRRMRPNKEKEADGDHK